MITYINNLFLTQKANKRLEYIKNDIDKKNFITRSCIITLSNGDDVFDIIPVFNLKFSRLYEDDLVVLGLAESRKAAIKLCSEMTALYFSEERNISMKDYFKGYIN